MKKIILLSLLAMSSVFFSCNNSGKDEEDDNDTSVILDDKALEGTPTDPTAPDHTTAPVTKDTNKTFIVPEQEVVDENAPLPAISFEFEKYDFGTITEGTVLKKSLSFTNTGAADLKIKEIKASCSCVSAKASKDVIKPGEKGTINIVFDSEGKAAPNDRAIIVVSNTMPAAKEVRFLVNVLEKKSK